jgi:hypothetical protein
MCGSHPIQPFDDGARSSEDVAHRLLAWQVFSCSPHAVIDSNPNPKYIMFTGMMTPGCNGQSGRTFCMFTGGQHG